MNAFLLNTGFWVDKEYIESIAVFNKLFASFGNVAKPVKTNEMGQLFVQFHIISANALEWLYKWIHENLLDGPINQMRDQEIKYITGSDEFAKAVYRIIYNKEFSHTNIDIQNIQKF